MTHETWGHHREELIKRIGRNNYVTWIEPLKFIGLADGVARFEVPTTFFGDWVKRNFGDHIVAHLTANAQDVARVEFAVTLTEPVNGFRPLPREPLPEKPGAIAAKQIRRPAASDDELPGAPLDVRFTFDSFVVGKPNELAHAAARRVAEGGPVSFNPLFLYGGVGLGKTHLMHAIAHELQARKPDLRVLYLSAEQFMYRFVQALRERQVMDCPTCQS